MRWRKGLNSVARFLSAISSTKAKPTGRVKPAARRKTTVRRKRKSYSEPYDAKKYAGSVHAFAGITPNEMKAERDDR